MMPSVPPSTFNWSQLPDIVSPSQQQLAPKHKATHQDTLSAMRFEPVALPLKLKQLPLCYTTGSFDRVKRSWDRYLLPQSGDQVHIGCAEPQVQDCYRPSERG